jgi:hypothetical protein
MRRDLVFPLAFLVMFSLLLAYFMRDWIHEVIIVPLAYVCWLIGLYYHFFPQVFFWALLLIFVLYMTARSLMVQAPREEFENPVRRFSHGPIEAFSAMLHKHQRGIYYKWLIANRLGRLTCELLNQREGRLAARRPGRLAGRDWNPPMTIGTYLEIGLNGSFAEYPRRGWRRDRPTPLDQDPEQVIEYLEAEMELHRNGNL